MSAKKGIIMQIKKRKAILLTADGEFKQCAAESHWRVGDEVAMPEQRFQRGWAVYSAAAVAAALLVLVSVLYPFGGSSSTYRIVAYITLDINPSIELGVDQRDIVRSAEGLNEHGERMVEQLAPVGRELDAVTTAIIKFADETGVIAHHINEDMGEIVVASTVATGEEWDIRSVSEKVKRSIQAELAVLHQDKADNIKVEDVVTPPAVREEARREGISTGKMAVKLLAEHKGLVISSEVLQQQPIGQVLKEAGGMSGLLDQTDEHTTARLFQELVDQRRQHVNERAEQPVIANQKDTAKAGKVKGKKHPGHDHQTDREAPNKSTEKQPGKKDASDKRATPKQEKPKQDGGKHDRYKNDKPDHHRPSLPPQQPKQEGKGGPKDGAGNKPLKNEGRENGAGRDRPQANSKEIEENKNKGQKQEKWELDRQSHVQPSNKKNNAAQENKQHNKAEKKEKNPSNKEIKNEKSTSGQRAPAKESSSARTSLGVTGGEGRKESSPVPAKKEPDKRSHADKQKDVDKQKDTDKTRDAEKRSSIDDRKRQQDDSRVFKHGEKHQGKSES